MFFFFFSLPPVPLSPTVFKTRYQIVVEIVQATTISNFPQVKKQKGKNPFWYWSHLLFSFWKSIWTPEIHMQSVCGGFWDRFEECYAFSISILFHLSDSSPHFCGVSIFPPPFPPLPSAKLMDWVERSYLMLLFSEHSASWISGTADSYAKNLSF